MQVFDVKFNDVNRTGNRFYVLFASDHATVDALTEDLREYGIVSGVKLIWHRDEKEIVIDDTRPIAISKTAVYSIQLPEYPVARYE
jgi:hypothetical protein